MKFREAFLAHRGPENPTLLNMICHLNAKKIYRQVAIKGIIPPGICFQSPRSPSPSRPGIPLPLPFPRVSLFQEADKQCYCSIRHVKMIVHVFFHQVIFF